MDQTRMYNDFCAVPHEFKTVPWWIWNGRMDYNELERQLVLMKEKGMLGWMLWVRFGIEIEYLSKPFFERVRFCVEKSAALGLHVWIWDEFAWPSGSGHNQVAQANPEHRMRVLSSFERTVEGPGEIRWDFSGSDDRRIEKVVAVPEHGGRMDLDAARDLTGFAEGLNIHGSVPSGRWRIFPLISRDFWAYIDALNPEAVESFIAHVHDRYAQWIGNYFGSTVKGFWLDEPRYLRFGQEKPQFAEPTIPWTKDLFIRLKQAGLDRIEATMAAVLGDIDPGNQPLRIRFWHTLIDFYRESFFGTLAQWAARQGLTYGGDCFTEDANNLVCLGDYFRAVSPLNEPGMDILTFSEDYHLKNPIMRKTVKFPSSLAHLENKDRCLCEGPGLLGWSATLEEMKAATDLLYAGGINKLVPNAFFYTIAHEHHYEPPSYFYQWPLWRFYDVYDRYVARLGYLLTRGRHVAPVALYYPTDSYLGHYNPISSDSNERYEDVLAKKSPRLGFLIKASMATADILLREQLDFDYVYDKVLTEATVNENQIRIGPEEFQILIFPPLGFVSEKVLGTLDTLCKQGGKVLFLGGPTVRRSEDGTEVNLPRRFPQAVLLNLESPHDLAELRSRLANSLSNLVRPNLRINCEGTKDYFTCLHRQTDDHDLYFIANFSGESRHAQVQLQSPGSLECWDLVSSRKFPVDSCPSDSGTVFEHAFASRESIVVVQDRRRKGPTIPNPANPLRLELADRWELNLPDDNLLLPPVLSFSSRWEKRLSWQGTTCYRCEFPFTVAQVPERLVLILDYLQTHWRAGSLKVYLDEIPLSIVPNTSIDHELLECSLRDLAHPGNNRVAIEYEHTDYLEPLEGVDLQSKRVFHPPVPKVRIMGHFYLKDGVIHPTGTQTVSASSWTEHGFPLYSGRGVYRQNFHLPGGWLTGARQVWLNFERLAEAARIVLNGREAGTVPWRPWKLEIREFLQNEENDLEIEVTNTQANQMYEEPRDSGILGKVWLEKH